MLAIVPHQARWCAAVLAFLVLVALSIRADARGPTRECRPDGLPVLLGEQGEIEIMQPLEYLGGNHLLVANRSSKPSKLRLVSADGEAIALANPPWTFEPSRFVARGRGVYALGTGRSLTDGQQDVVLVRWGTDSRPRLTKIATAAEVVAAPRAATVGEHLAVVWAERSSKGASVRASFVDLEELRVSEPRELGPLAKHGVVEVSAVDAGFVVLWSSPSGLMRAGFERHGKARSDTGTQPLGAPDKLHTAIACGSRAWLLHDANERGVSISVADAAGKIQKVGLIESSTAERGVVPACVDDELMVAHRTFSTTQGNVVFWLSTVDAKGKLRARRVKDTKGSADDIRLLQLGATEHSYAAFWAEGTGPTTKLWSRSIACAGGGKR